ncbi:MAG TPA: DUF4235 domain-containing protein [Solirubrobacteraceae bacterium]|jgi:hypothetical protein
MAKLLFLPFSIGTGLLAGLIGKKTFERLWGAIDDREPPQPENRRVHLGKLALALGLEGAVFRVVKGLVDHGSRYGFARFTGRWPGDEEPEPE